MQETLRKQLLRLRENILPARRDGRHSHWRTAESLNLVREEVLNAMSDEEREIWGRLTPAIDLDRPKAGGGPYTASSEDTLRLCDQLLAIIEGTIADRQGEGDSPERPLSRVVPLTRSVFLVHGHDTANTLRLSTLLKRRFQLNPVILSERPGRGRVLLEKFEEEAGVCSFAFALLTADDLVASEHQPSRQARPNVLFELGWFYGRLGRGHVCILHQSGTSIPSDLAGIARVAFRYSVEEALGDIELELQAAGIIGQLQAEGV